MKFRHHHKNPAARSALNESQILRTQYSPPPRQNPRQVLVLHCLEHLHPGQWAARRGLGGSLQLVPTTPGPRGSRSGTIHTTPSSSSQKSVPKSSLSGPPSAPDTHILSEVQEQHDQWTRGQPCFGVWEVFLFFILVCKPCLLVPDL